MLGGAPAVSDGRVAVVEAASSLYERDFLGWTEQQARTLRELGLAGTNLPIDWENVAEELESSGSSQRRELRSRLLTVIVHLLKLRASAVTRPRAGWQDTIDRERFELTDGLLRQSPGLRREIASTVADLIPKAKSRVERELRRRGELTGKAQAALAQATFTEEQVLGDWFPDEPR